MEPANLAADKRTAKPAIAGGRWRKYAIGLLFLLPEIVIFTIFVWIPILKGGYFSFLKVDFVNGNHFVGFDNFREAFGKEELGIAIRNTLYYILLGIIVGYWVPSLAAIAIAELRWFQGLAKLVYYFPSIVPAVVLYNMWNWLYEPLGPLNHFLTFFGFTPVDWLTDRHVSMLSIVLMESWQGFGGAMLIYLAAVASIPKDQYEAAEIDGAGVLQRIRHITIPGVKHVFVYMLIMQIISVSQGYQTHTAMTGGGPNNATLTYMMLIVKEAFTNLNYGAASALGTMMFVVMTLLSVLLLKLQKKEEA